MAEAVKTSNLTNKNDLHEMELRVTKWVIGLALAQIGLLVGLFLKMPH